MNRYSIDAEICIRCGASSSIAPELFGMSSEGAEVIRQPQTEAEALAAEQARALCPAGAIHLEN